MATHRRTQKTFEPRRWRVALALAALLLAPAGGALAQEQTGNLYGTAVSTGGEALPGVAVELTGLGAPRTQVTDERGSFRFLNLDPGSYILTASLDGFSTVRHGDVIVGVGRNTDLDVTLPPAGPAAMVTEVIEITGESPLLDERKVAKGTTISQIELEKIPTARDPWAIVTQTPGVLSDRINVGGNESGQQAVFTAPAATDDENSFNIDGVPVTDMAAVGSSPTYYDFDQLEEVQVSTGGTDIEKVSAGASLNLVTKRGSNNPRGSARFLLTDADEQLGIFEQADPDVQGDLENGDGAGGLAEQSLSGTPGNSVDEVVDFGFEAGGPIVRDRFWIWGSYGRNDIRQFAQTGDPDNTLLENSAVKLNGQPVTANSAVASWNRGDKIKDGRRPAANVVLESTWDQSGPTEIWKVEDTHVVSSDLYLTGLYSYVDGGFALQSKGAPYPSPGIPVEQEQLLDVDGVWRNSYFGGISDRNADNYQVDGSYFFDTGDLAHELKVGVSYRKFEVVSPFGFPGRGVRHITCEAIETCGVLTAGGLAVGDDRVDARRIGDGAHEMDYTAGWVQDTLTSGKWTVNAGLRYDLQDAENTATTVQANAAFPDLLPAIDFPGNDAGGFEWETVSPRLGVTYALGAERRTLLRASFARFAEQLQSADVTRVNPTGFSQIVFFYDDANGNDLYDDGEAFTPFSHTGVDPADPDALENPNENDPNLDPSLTDEIVLGLEHAFRPELVVGVDLTWRNVSDVLETRPFVVEDGVRRLATRDDYVLFTTRSGGQDLDGDGVADVPFLPDGSGWSADVYGLRPGLQVTGGTLLTNGDSEREYLGAALTFTKRLSNRWMARGYVQYGEAEWDVAESTLFFDNPTDAPSAADGTAGDPGGGLFVVQSAGSGPFENVLIQSTWSANLNGMYQVAPERPWGFNVAGNLLAREGYPLPYQYTVDVPQLGEVQAAAVPEVDRFRADDVYKLDLRLEKDMRFTDNLSGIVSLDAFNVLNDTFVMGREVELEQQTANFLTQSLSPRIYRLGFRLNWR